MSATSPLDARIRAVLSRHARLSGDPGALRADEDLYAAGMTSLASVSVMLALEGEFGVEFPDQMLTRSVFNSIASIHDALSRLMPAAADVEAG